VATTTGPQTKKRRSSRRSNKAAASMPEAKPKPKLKTRPKPKAKAKTKQISVLKQPQKKIAETSKPNGSTTQKSNSKPAKKVKANAKVRRKKTTILKTETDATLPTASSKAAPATPTAPAPLPKKKKGKTCDKTTAAATASQVGSENKNAVKNTSNGRAKKRRRNAAAAKPKPKQKRKNSKHKHNKKKQQTALPEECISTTAAPHTEKSHTRLDSGNTTPASIRAFSLLSGGSTVTQPEDLIQMLSGSMMDQEKLKLASSISLSPPFARTETECVSPARSVSTASASTAVVRMRGCGRDSRDMDRKSTSNNNILRRFSGSYMYGDDRERERMSMSAGDLGSMPVAGMTTMRVTGGDDDQELTASLRFQLKCRDCFQPNCRDRDCFDRNDSISDRGESGSVKREKSSNVSKKNISVKNHKRDCGFGFGFGFDRSLGLDADVYRDNTIPTDSSSSSNDKQNHNMRNGAKSQMLELLTDLRNKSNLDEYTVGMPVHPGSTDEYGLLNLFLEPCDGQRSLATMIPRLVGDDDYSHAMKQSMTSL